MLLLFFISFHFEATQINYRLDGSLVPSLYELDIKPYVGTEMEYGDKAFTYEGKVVITVKCVAPTNKVVLHAKRIRIDVSQLRFVSNDSDIEIEKSIRQDVEREFIIMNLNRECKRGVEYKLSIEFTGDITQAVYGFYRGSYVDSKGVTQ